MSYGWILVENGKPVITSDGSIEIFKTKDCLFNYYKESFGQMNDIKKVEYSIRK